MWNLISGLEPDTWALIITVVVAAAGALRHATKVESKLDHVAEATSENAEVVRRGFEKNGVDHKELHGSVNDLRERQASVETKVGTLCNGRTE